VPVSSDKPINVAIVEDRRELREGLSMLINGTEGFVCPGKYRSMEEALSAMAATAPPDIVLSDIGLPGMSGIEGIRLLKDRFPSLIILMLTIYEDDERIFDAICAGACGYLLKKTPPARLLEALREAVQGGAPMSPEVAARVISLFREIRPPQRPEYELSPHETRLLKLFIEGQLQNRCRGTGRHGPHRIVPPAQCLRQTSGSLQVGSGREGAAESAGLGAAEAGTLQERVAGSGASGCILLGGQQPSR